MKARSHNSQSMLEALEGRRMMSAVVYGEFQSDRHSQAAVSVLALASAQSADRSYISRGTAQFINANDFVGSGFATHLGRYTEAGTAQFSPTADPTILQVNATSTYTAANGDQLYAVINGQLNGVTGAITATVTYAGGTGRFANAIGSSTLTGQLLPGGAVQVTTEGAINF